MSDTGELFTTRMRKATRGIHNISDALVNTKFAISLRDETVWGKGIFIFYHIFAYIEDARERLNMPEFNSLFVHNALYRKSAFEEDLKHYLGEDWRSIPKSQALEDYIKHLQDLEKNNPKLLMAYCYHLYLGLLSGGQILSKKRRMFDEKNKSDDIYNDKVTDFSGVNISELKVSFREAMNKIADKMTNEEQQAFIDESNQVFILNNSIVKSIEGQNIIVFKLLIQLSAVVVAAVGVLYAYRQFNK